MLDSSSCSAAYGRSTMISPSFTSTSSAMASADASSKRSNARFEVEIATRLLNHALTSSSASSGTSNQRRSCSRRLSAGFKNIAEAAQGHDRDAGVLQHLAQPVNVDLDHVLAGGRIHREHALVDRSLADRLAGAHQQDLEHGVFLGPQYQPPTLHREDAGAAVVLQRPEADLRRADAVRAPDDGLQARRQLARGERVDEVVVGAEVQASDPVLEVSAGRQRDHGAGAPALPQALQHDQAVERGERQVEHDGVIAFGGEQRVGLRAVVGRVDCVAVLLQRLGEPRGQLEAVFHQEQTHVQGRVKTVEGHDRSALLGVARSNTLVGVFHRRHQTKAARKLVSTESAACERRAEVAAVAWHDPRQPVEPTFRKPPRRRPSMKKTLLCTAILAIYAIGTPAFADEIADLKAEIAAQKLAAEAQKA